MFPKVPDYHKPNKPLVPNGLGVFYVLFSAIYLFSIYFFEYFFEPGKVTNGASAPLTLAVCILFGGFMGLLDDWIDLKWRYKAFLPIIAAIPLIAFAYSLTPPMRPAITIPFFGIIQFGGYYYSLIIPLLVTIITNTVNQLGGLNGLETVCPAIVMIGLMIMSGQEAILLYGPLVMWLLLASLNFQGKIFVGNTGSFAVGMTLASFAIISDLKFSLVVSLFPYILNSVLVLLTFFFFRTKAKVSFDGRRLSSDHKRSLITIITYHRPLTERQVVLIISFFVMASTLVPILVQLMSP